MATVMLGLNSPANSRWNPSPFFSSDHTRNSPTPTHQGVHPQRGGLSPLPRPSPAIRDAAPKSCVSPTKWHPCTAANIPRAQRPRKAVTNGQSWPGPPETRPDKSTRRAWRQRRSDCIWVKSSGQWEGEGGLATLCAQQRDSGTTRESMTRFQQRLQWHREKDPFHSWGSKKQDRRSGPLSRLPGGHGGSLR